MSLYRGERVLDGTAFFTDTLPFYFNRAEETFDLQMHSHRFVEIVLVNDGEGFHFIDDEVVRVAKNDLFLLPAGAKHVFRPVHTGPHRPLTVYNCLYEPSKLRSCLQHLPGFEELGRSSLCLFGEDAAVLPGPGWLHLRDSDGQWNAWFRTAYREFTDRAPGYLIKLYSLFIELAVMLERQLEFGESSPPAAQDNQVIKEVVRQINTSFQNPLTARNLAAASHLSERHFHRLFRQYVGCTFNDYVQKKRIERSCELLTSTWLPVNEIMRNVGYADRKHFLTLFKQTTGLSPSVYRRQTRQTDWLNGGI
ncbi:helix-turn-helix domain-containing protein [Paenibacillus sp. DXFW5]|uniref:Helix-turn-helix domain-containing protein n=1 Tax=Paenibacillus rhizolycopersici TaxID=2780073 RepID=A0ABS2H4V5_9BACL|nr:AraC family transcriptional regulator [Paenibacillus rhizolycopersici]MBM6994830.1 helix-turn-helix domain-containing protein [Paenibacillus rhizolycopersici]